MVLDNDTRGWIMSIISGVACIIGASVICVDLIVRLIPRWRNFRIQDSNRFLAGSLSLSAGVMIYSALYSMLPSSKSSLIKGGLEPSAAAFAMIGCFLGGVVGIQVLSKTMHRFLPSHVVDCDHTHKDEETEVGDDSCDDDDSLNEEPREDRPLLSRELSLDGHQSRPTIKKAQTEVRSDAPFVVARNTEKASLSSKIAQRMTSFIRDSKHNCDEGGPCFGYSNPCGNECYRVITQNPNKTPFTATASNYGSLNLNAPGPFRQQPKRFASTPAESSLEHINGGFSTNSRKPSSITSVGSAHADSHMHHSTHSHGLDQSGQLHHHHVASNAFLSIGLQTSIAIALHKVPEGFITYATNHANPRLGVSIFMALFIHNITEGFALALPLYLALNNRLKAMFWAALLGGASQPLGAAIAALWFKVAQSRDMTPSEGVYGVMFAITSGIMTNVALQLFAESLALIHRKGLCVAMAFVGMGVLGFSNALTAS